MNSPRIHPSLFHTARSVEYLLPPCHYISGIVLFTTLTGQYLRKRVPLGRSILAQVVNEELHLGYVCEARGMGVTHMPDNLAKFGVIERSCVNLFEIWREGCYSKSCVAAPCQWLSLPGATSPQGSVHSRTFLEVSVLAGALCAADQRGDKLRACTSPSCTAAAQRPFGEVALSACVT